MQSPQKLQPKQIDAARTTQLQGVTQLEQYLLSAYVEYCREHKRSPFRGIEMRYLFDSFEDAFHPERATEAGFTHLAADAKRTPRVARHLKLRVRHDLPEYYERCVNYLQTRYNGIDLEAVSR